MAISIFLSHPQPCFPEQKEFIDKLRARLEERGFLPRTLGVSDYSITAPLEAIRRLMSESNGLLCVAFRRTFIQKGQGRQRDGREYKDVAISDRWLTSPWAHIEPAMAYQIGLPILILREAGVLDDGVLEKGILGLYMPQFDLSAPLDQQYLASDEWNAVQSQWERQVHSVVKHKGEPPRLY